MAVGRETCGRLALDSGQSCCHFALGKVLTPRAVLRSDTMMAILISRRPHQPPLLARTVVICCAGAANCHRGEAASKADCPPAEQLLDVTI